MHQFLSIGLIFWSVADKIIETCQKIGLSPSVKRPLLIEQLCIRVRMRLVITIKAAHVIMVVSNQDFELLNSVFDLGWLRIPQRGDFLEVAPNLDHLW